MHIFLIKNLAVGRILLFSHNACPWVGTYSYTFFSLYSQICENFQPHREQAGTGFTDISCRQGALSLYGLTRSHVQG